MDRLFLCEGMAELVMPQIMEVQPAQVAAGDEVILIGSGGYLSCGAGGYVESARSFQLYLDGEPIGPMSCFVNHCEATLDVPESTTPGKHVISVEGGSSLEIDVVGR
jgi:hypothetical protein